MPRVIIGVGEPSMDDDEGADRSVARDEAFVVIPQTPRREPAFSPERCFPLPGQSTDAITEGGYRGKWQGP